MRDRRHDRDRAHRDDRDHYDERDRKRSKRDEEPPKPSSRDDKRDRDRNSSKPESVKEEVRLFEHAHADRALLNNQSSRPSTANAEEEAKKARAAKVEAWKKKIEEKKRQEAAAKTATDVSASASPVTPLEANSPAPAPEKDVPDNAKSPAPYAGKFDPKAIAKRAASAMEKQKAALGGDVVIPKSAVAASNGSVSNVANNKKASSSRVQGEPH